MKRISYLVSLVVVMGIVAPAGSMAAQTPGKKGAPVPITYPGDTEKTIARRAQWIENAKKEGSLVWWGILRQPEAEGVIAEFNKIYPFIKVEFWAGSSSAHLAPKVEEDFISGRHLADLQLGGGPSNLPRWREMGMITKFTDLIPMIEKINKNGYGEYGDWAVPGHTPMTPQYNTKLVPPSEAPKSWEDMVDPKWKGHVGMVDDTKGWIIAALGEGGWGIEKTEEYLRRIRLQNPVWVPSHVAAAGLLATGEFKVYAGGHIHSNVQLQEKGAPVDWVRAAPVWVSGPSVTLQTKARHPNSARLFLEWVFSPQGLIKYEEKSDRGVVFPGSGTRQAKRLEGLPLVFETERLIMKSLELDLEPKFKKIMGVAK